MDSLTREQSQSSLLLPANFVENIKNGMSSNSQSSSDAKSVESDSCSSSNFGGEDSKQVTKLFVGNLPTSTTLPELLEVFKKYGPVNEKLSVVKDQNYAFVHFYNKKDAEVALREVNDSLFKDRYIRVQFSTSQGYTHNKTRTQVEREKLMMGSKEKLHGNSLYLSGSDSRSGSMYNLDCFAEPKSSLSSSMTSLNAEGFRPITGRCGPSQMSSSSSTIWPQFGGLLPGGNSSLLMPAHKMTNTPTSAKLDFSSKHPGGHLNSSYQPFLPADMNNNQLTNTQLLNLFYFTQFQQQQQLQQQKQALLQQQILYQQQEQQRLLWEQRYSNMAASSRMPKSVTMENMSSSAAGPINNYMLSSLAAANHQSFASNPAHQITRSNTLFSFANNHI